MKLPAEPQVTQVEKLVKSDVFLLMNYVSIFFRLTTLVSEG